MTELDNIKAQWVSCRKCGLCNEGRSKVVFSDGPETARIMLVGQNPGATEDACGIPFSGPAGKLMDKILASVGITRQQCYWTNVTKCMSVGDRAPKMEEIKACKPLLEEEIRHVRPDVILIVGRPAAQALIGLKGAIGAIAGQWTEVNMAGLVIPALVVYHPAALLHTQHIDPETCNKYRRSLWESMKSLREFLDSTKDNRSFNMATTKKEPGSQLDLL